MVRGGLTRNRFRLGIDPESRYRVRRSSNDATPCSYSTDTRTDTSANHWLRVEGLMEVTLTIRAVIRQQDYSTNLCLRRGRRGQGSPSVPSPGVDIRAAFQRQTSGRKQRLGKVMEVGGV